MANEQNLKPQNTRTKEEQREIARKGGIASGKSRRKRKALKEELLLLLEEGDYQKKLCTALIKGAIKSAAMGDTKAFNAIRDTIGENVKDQHAVEYDKRRLDVELLKVETQLPDKESDAELDDGFLEALNAQAGDVWADGDDHVVE